MVKDLKFKDIYNFLPRFVAGDEVEYRDGKYLSPVERRFEWNHTEFGLVISPALITGESGGSKHYFPGKRERIVESALIELADPENPNFHETESILVVRLNFLVEVVAELSEETLLSAGDIDLALHVLADTKYKLTCGDSQFRFYSIEQLSRVERNGEVYYRAKLTSTAPGAGTVFDYLFGQKKLSAMVEEFGATL